MNNRHPLPSIQSREEIEEIEAIEESLRLCAPALRPELRERVLARCQAAPSTCTRPSRRPVARVAWRLALVGAMCVGQWIVVPQLDARSQAAIHGRPHAPLWALATPGRSRAQASRDWPQALRRRALLLSALMNSSDGVAPWPAPPGSQPGAQQS